MNKLLQICEGEIKSTAVLSSVVDHPYSVIRNAVKCIALKISSRYYASSVVKARGWSSPPCAEIESKFEVVSRVTLTPMAVAQSERNIQTPAHT